MSGTMEEGEGDEGKKMSRGRTYGRERGEGAKREKDSQHVVP